jgi:hypothetical protein
VENLLYNEHSPIHPYQRLWMNKQIPIPEFEDEYKYIYAIGCG